MTKTKKLPPCLTAALRYLELGWSALALCPPDHAGLPSQHQAECKSPGKRPMSGWKVYQERLPREAEVRLWWNRHANSNVGIALGPVSNLLGLDIDGDEGEKLLLQLSAGVIPNTLSFKTGNGRRLLFKWPSEGIKIRSLSSNGHEAIRILAKGSQTVAPPSIHPSGSLYEWIEGHSPDDSKLADCPAWLLQLDKALQAKEGQVDGQGGEHAIAANLEEGQANPVTRAKAYLLKCDPAIASQGGHNQTFKVAVKLVKGFALDPEIALFLMLQYYNPKCQPPWTEKELQHKIDDAMKAENADGFLLASNKAPALPAKKPAGDNAIKAHSRKFQDIECKPVEWLWKNWLPLGKLAILDGDPGLGKSTMLLDLAARISTTGIMPDNTQGITGAVVVLSAEDAAEDTIKPRLEAAHANLSKIIELSHVEEKGVERPIEIPADLGRIDDKIKEHEARLLIVDPLMAFLYGADANKDQEIRRVLYKLSKIAEKRRCAVICMRHLNKGSSTKAIYRGNSSIGVIGHARTGLLVAPDPDDDNKRLLAVSKCNLAMKPKSLRFVLDPVGDVCRIGWCGISSYKADDLVAPPPTEEEKAQKEEGHHKTQQARAILEMLIADAGQVEIKIARAECLAAGLNARAIERAAKELGLIIQHTTDAHGKRTYFYTPCTTTI